VLREGIERFPAAFLDEQAVEIRLLCDHREVLVAERTRLINRLRWNLVVLDPELEAKIPSRKLDYPGHLQRIIRRLRAMPQTARVRVAREQVKRISTLTREAEALKRELRDLVRAHRPELLAETGCRPLCAAILIGQTAGAERFASDAHFARMAGVAPIPASSGRHERHRLHRGGNRQLNRALHVIAITRGRIDPETRVYLAPARKPKARAASRPCAASSDTSHATTTGCSYEIMQLSDTMTRQHRSEFLAADSLGVWKSFGICWPSSPRGRGSGRKLPPATLAIEQVVAELPTPSRHKQETSGESFEARVASLAHEIEKGGLLGASALKDAVLFCGRRLLRAFRLARPLGC
jgi:hypothetical protein